MQTSEVSSPGIASSSADLLVEVREGISVVAEVGADISIGFESMRKSVVVECDVVVGVVLGARRRGFFQ
jgi:hypothetical protein